MSHWFLRTRESAKAEAIESYLCIDDYGDAVYRCAYSGSLTWPDDVIFMGSFMACVIVSDVCHKVHYKEPYKQSRRLYDEMEANCNVCKHLKRLPFERVTSIAFPTEGPGGKKGPPVIWKVKQDHLRGECTNPKGRPDLIPGHTLRTEDLQRLVEGVGPWPKNDREIWFHPDHSLLMPCWEHR